MYLEMRNISKLFPGVRALHNVQFGVDEGEVVALLGENGAGKSTLMNVLGGILKKTEGQIMIGGTEVSIKNVHDAQTLGIAFIHQELSLFSQLSVQENLFIDHFQKKCRGLFLDKKRMQKESMEVFKLFGISIDPKKKVKNLPMGEQQLVEIAAAVLKNSKIIILDEPTSSLTDRECEKLFYMMDQLRKERKLIIFITHDLEKALKVSDRVYVLKDGENAGTGISSQLEKADIVSMMIGDRKGKQFAKQPKESTGEEILSFSHVTTQKVKDVSFFLKRGEILGMYGLIGSGRTELMHALYGLDKILTGAIAVDGQEIKKKSPKTLMDLGVAYLTENRRDEGLFLEQSASTNVTITVLNELRAGPLRLIQKKKEIALTQKIIEDLHVVIPGPAQLVGKLSGGNQQKIVIGKWLHTKPRIFIMDEPTRGIDVGAKSEIYRLIDQIVQTGVSVILISSEIEEIIGMSDRVIVMANGRVAAQLQGEEITNEKIVKYTMS
ncbi:MAG: sugar ABC transporter ATP-binding protein [Ruthenibacterium sp.]